MADLLKQKILNKNFLKPTFILLIILFILGNLFPTSVQKLISPLVHQGLTPLSEGKKGYEVFGFAPYWTFNKLDNVDFNTLTTFSYFGIDVNSDGSLDLEGPGYNTFQSEQATAIFKQAHAHGTRVVLTITQMDSDAILALLDDPEAQKQAINSSVAMVRDRGIDGLNVDFEYIGNPGPEYRQKFSTFVQNLTTRMHDEVPSSRVTVSVYAAAAKEPRMYDIGALGASADGIFMMAYDFATLGADQAMPTSPLYGYKDGTYWYDISTAVEDFLKLMPAEKLILGLPWYGYNYPVYQPGVKAARNDGYYAYYWRRGYRYSYFVPNEAAVQTYAIAEDNVATSSGWDSKGEVGWKAYVDENGVWRMIFLEDEKSLAIKYDFAKDHKLAGVGMWALGFDDGKTEMWTLLNKKFGTKLADKDANKREIKDLTYQYAQ